MHQPYYVNLLTKETDYPWVRLHGTKDYLDMLQILEKYPKVKQTFNLVPSLLEQVEDYTHRTVKDKFLELSYKQAKLLTEQEKDFILNNFFSINPDKVIFFSPRYFELYSKKKAGKEFSEQDYLDLQVWFNLAWIDPSFRESFPELKRVVRKARFFNEEDKHAVLDKHLVILEEIIPAYKKAVHSQQVEVTVTPYYHPILPLLYNTNTTKEANPRALLPRIGFSYPLDAKAQIDNAVSYFKDRFGAKPLGMWPSEEAVSEHILPFIIQSGIKWIVADEAILFKSLKRKKRDTELLYQPHLLKREEGDLNIIFRDRNLSDLIGFSYSNWKPEHAVDDFMRHLEETAKVFDGKDIFVAIAMDGENAWEYFVNDGHDFLNLLYERLSESKLITTITPSQYLEKFPPKFEIKRLAAGSWIYGEFGKWIGNPQKILAWEYLAKARKEFQEVLDNSDMCSAISDKLELAWKQMYVLEGSDWFWWYGEDPNGSFDKLFRMHLSNFYTILGKQIPDYLKKPI